MGTSLNNCKNAELQVRLRLKDYSSKILNGESECMGGSTNLIDRCFAPRDQIVGAYGNNGELLDSPAMKESGVSRVLFNVRSLALLGGIFRFEML